MTNSPGQEQNFCFPVHTYWFRDLPTPDQQQSFQDILLKLLRKGNWYYFLHKLLRYRGFSDGSVVKNLPAMQETHFSWVEKIPQRRKWQPTPVFLPGKSHGQRSLVGYSPWVCRRVRHDSDKMHTHIHWDTGIKLLGPTTGKWTGWEVSNMEKRRAERCKWRSSPDDNIWVAVTSVWNVTIYFSVGQACTFFLLFKLGWLGSLHN